LWGWPFFKLVASSGSGAQKSGNGLFGGKNNFSVSTDVDVNWLVYYVCCLYKGVRISP
jgi:hypothetical protein